MSGTVSVPSLGLAITEATLGEWLKHEGEKVTEGEPIAVVITEKVTFEVTAPSAGTILKLLVPEHTVVKIGEPIAIVGEPGEDISGAAPQKQEPADKRKEASPGPQNTTGVRPVRALPAARHLAAQYGVDLRDVEGTGENGAITKDDVERFVAKSKESQPIHETAVASLASPGADPSEEIIPYVGIRRSIGEHLQRSVSTIPHVSTVAEVDMTAVGELREVLAKSVEGTSGPKPPSYLAFIARAALLSVPEFPLVNASLVDDEIIVKKRIHLGVAVASPDGLIVPVIKDANLMSVNGLTYRIGDLAEKARSRRLTTDDVEGGTFTISNAGAYGAVIATPIISWPQSTVLWVGRIAPRPAVVDGEIAIRQMMFLVLAYDHRILDGAVAAQFLQKIRRYLENPLSLM